LVPDDCWPEWQVAIDRVRAAELRLIVTGIADTLRGYIGGHVPTRFRDGNDLFDLRVLVPERTLASRSDVEDLVLAVQFNSLRLPFVVFLAAPFCVAGTGTGLLLGGQALAPPSSSPSWSCWRPTSTMAYCWWRPPSACAPRAWRAWPRRARPPSCGCARA
jgi:multidrug efflux pump subunit AcrB